MTQPEALRLAEDMLNCSFGRTVTVQKAAAKLRRLHAENRALTDALFQAQEAAKALLAQRDALLEALLRIESAVDWYLGRSSFTQTTQLKGLEHSANVRKELFAAHDEARAAIKQAEGETE